MRSARPFGYVAGGMLLLLLFVVPPAAAQSLYFGPQGGVNSSSFRGDTGALTSGIESASLQRRTSFQLGAVLVADLSDRLALQTEALYIQKGAVVNGSLFGGLVTQVPVTATYRFAYVQVPLLLKFRFPNASPVTPFAQAGPSMALQTAAGVESSVAGTGQIRRFDSIERFDLGAAVGGGIRYSFADSALLLDLRYTPGILDVAAADDMDLRTDTFMLSLAYLFPL